MWHVFVQWVPNSGTKRYLLNTKQVFHLWTYCMHCLVVHHCVRRASEIYDMSCIATIAAETFTPLNTHSAFECRCSHSGSFSRQTYLLSARHRKCQTWGSSLFAKWWQCSMNQITLHGLSTLQVKLWRSIYFIFSAWLLVAPHIGYYYPTSTCMQVSEAGF